jgi:hypothetical protein
VVSTGAGPTVLIEFSNAGMSRRYSNALNARLLCEVEHRTHDIEDICTLLEAKKPQN